MVVAEPGLHEHLRRVALGDGPLAGAVEAEAIGVAHDAAGDDVDGLFPRDVFELAVAAELRGGQAIFAVENAAHVVALHAEQTLVNVGELIALDGHDLAVAHAYLDVATGAAETARGLIPRDAFPGGRQSRADGRGGALGGSQSLGDDGGGGGERGGFDEVAALHGGKGRGSEVGGTGASQGRLGSGAPSGTSTKVTSIKTTPGRA